MVLHCLLPESESRFFDDAVLPTDKEYAFYRLAPYSDWSFYRLGMMVRRKISFKFKLELEYARRLATGYGLGIDENDQQVSQDVDKAIELFTKIANFEGQYFSDKGENKDITNSVKTEAAGFAAYCTMWHEKFRDLQNPNRFKPAEALYWAVRNYSPSVGLTPNILSIVDLVDNHVGRIKIARSANKLANAADDRTLSLVQTGIVADHDQNPAKLTLSPNILSISIVNYNDSVKSQLTEINSSFRDKAAHLYNKYTQYCEDNHLRPLRRCASKDCGNDPSIYHGKLNKCAGSCSRNTECRNHIPLYCSIACQKLDWTYHKQVCRKIPRITQS